MRTRQILCASLLAMIFMGCCACGQSAGTDESASYNANLVTGGHDTQYTISMAATADDLFFVREDQFCDYHIMTDETTVIGTVPFANSPGPLLISDGIVYYGDGTNLYAYNIVKQTFQNLFVYSQAGSGDIFGIEGTDLYDEDDYAPLPNTGSSYTEDICKISLTTQERTVLKTVDNLSVPFLRSSVIYYSENPKTLFAYHLLSGQTQALLNISQINQIFTFDNALCVCARANADHRLNLYRVNGDSLIPLAPEATADLLGVAYAFPFNNHLYILGNVSGGSDLLDYNADTQQVTCYTKTDDGTSICVNDNLIFIAERYLQNPSIRSIDQAQGVMRVIPMP